MTPLDLEEIPTVGEGVKAVADSQEANPLLERLRARHEALKGDKTADMDIPGYQGLLVARYRRLSSQEMTELRADTDDLLEYNTAFLVEACEELFGRDGETLQPLSKEHPVRFDKALAEILDFPAETAREAVSGVFDGNELAILAHGDQVAMWMVNGSDDLGK